jgi:hypothetical protein
MLTSQLSNVQEALDCLNADYVRDRISTLMSANEGVTSELIEHALKILRRHVCACIRFGIEPQIDRTIVEGVEDFRLAKDLGEEWSVLAALPEDFADKLAAAWQTRYTQYEPPKADHA